MPTRLQLRTRASLVLLIMATFCPRTNASALPGPVLPDGIGVNIHFTDPRPGEMKMLADGGFTWVRMDFSWAGIEHKKGEYDFSAYDRLLKTLDEYHIRPVFILDYQNNSYDDGLSPHTDEGRAAFARWAAAAAGHFKGRGIIWEMYNEPNIGFWKPITNVDDYAGLALAVGKALRDSAPDKTYVGPASSTIDFAFLETCFKAGCLEYWSAVSVHPYRQKGPETAADEYRRLRLLINQYSPKDGAGKPARAIPILSGEWGYSADWEQFDVDRQGKFLPREYLTNIANDVPLSIWYDWHDDGTSPKEPEHHFGTVAAEYHAGRDPVYDPKPAYVAAQVLTSQLRGFRYNKRLIVDDPGINFVLLFTREVDPKQVKLAVWTTARSGAKLTIPASAGTFRATDYLGKPLPDLLATETGLSVAATDGLQYLEPEIPNDLLSLAAAWERAPLEMVIPGGQQVSLSLSIKNPLAGPVTVWDHPSSPEKLNQKLAAGEATTVPASAFAERSDDPRPLRSQLGGSPIGGFTQQTDVIVTNPLRIIPLPASDGALIARVENPTGEAFKGRLAVFEKAFGLDLAAQDFDLKAGQKEATLRLPYKTDGRSAYRVGWRIFDGSQPQPIITLSLPIREYLPIEFSADAFQLVADGDAKLASDLHLAPGTPPSGPPAPGIGALELRYRFDAGWKFARLAPKKHTDELDGREPESMEIWVFGDGQGNVARLRFTDSADQTFQSAPRFSPAGHAADKIDWIGWRCLTFPLDGEGASHWGGPDDGSVHYPIHIDTLFLIDSAGRHATQGTIYLAAPTLVSR